MSRRIIPLGDVVRIGKTVPEHEIKGTGQCFELCTLYFAQLLSEDRARLLRNDFWLVHGICLNEQNNPYSHAWIEDGDDEVHFPGILSGKYFADDKPQMGFIVTARQEFYGLFRVQDCTKYTWMQAKQTEEALGGKPPPWEKKYIQLCADYGPEDK